jgi:subtilase family serine protease
MRRLASVAGATAMVAGLTIVSLTGSAGASSSPGYTRLGGSAAPFTSHARVTGAVAGSVKLSIQVWLKPNIAAAQRYAMAVSTPGNKLFHHYLRPDAYTTRFAASRNQASKVESWLRSKGFTAVHTDSQRNYVRATASVSKINAAFRVKLDIYKSSAAVNGGRYALRANNRPVAIPSALASSVLGVTGLDNASAIIPLERPSTRPAGVKAPKAGASSLPPSPCSEYYGQHFAAGLPQMFGVTRFPTEVCGYSARQIRAAYGANMKVTGRHQTVALIELGLAPDMFLTLQDYAKKNHMPAPNTHRYTELSLGRGTACGDDFFIEEQLDVESSYDMAPKANQLVVGGDSCNDGDAGLQGLFDADLAVINGFDNHPLASAASNSWEGGDESQPASNTNIEHAYLVRAAAEGVGEYFSAGDGSGVLSPSDDPFSVAVGGTTVGISQHFRRLFETGWSTGESFLIGGNWVFEGEQGASGGGPSILWKQPAYQVGVVPNKLAKAPGNRGGKVRSVPDISADADPFTGFAVGLLLQLTPNGPLTYVQEDFGGTSEAAPIVAGMVTAAEQDQHHSFGLINPEIYRLFGSSALNDPVPITRSTPPSYRGTACNAFTCGIQILTTFDDQSPSMFGYTGQVTLRGYDNMTGVGTPRGQLFIRGLRAEER